MSYALCGVAAGSTTSHTSERIRECLPDAPRESGSHHHHLALEQRRDRAPGRCAPTACLHSSEGAFDMRKLPLALIALLTLGIGFATYSMQAAATSANAQQASGDLSQKIRLLSSANPIERATAACQIREMGKQATAAIPHLIALLGDDTPINVALDCGERHRWMNKENSNNHTTPGREAGAALAVMGAPAVEPLIGALRDAQPVARANAAWALGVIKDPRT